MNNKKPAHHVPYSANPNRSTRCAEKRARVSKDTSDALRADEREPTSQRCADQRSKGLNTASGSSCDRGRTIHSRETRTCKIRPCRQRAHHVLLFGIMCSSSPGRILCGLSSFPSLSLVLFFPPLAWSRNGNHPHVELVLIPT